MKYFNNIKNLEELKKEYRRLAILHHPDKGGDWKTMAAINNEYEILFNSLPKNPNNTSKEESTDFPDIINSIINYIGIDIEICGSWIWLSGETKKYKEELKKLGFFWASKKLKWYWRPEEEKTKKRGKTLSMDRIRELYGSEKVNTKGFQCLA